jgi:phenylalanyl-tRNA synthetase beta chain
MKIPLTWLKEHTPLTGSPMDIADNMIRLGHEVEGVEQPRAAVKGVRIGQVREMTPHPDADKLKLLNVDIGEAKTLPIVCGATNMDVGDKVPVATIGTSLPNGMKIKKSKIRGQTSFGMCCSEAELALAEDATGLLILPADAPVGAEIGDYMELEEAVFDLSITPNRGDCMSAHGIARDLAADGDLPFAEASACMPATSLSVAPPAVSVSAGKDCHAYLARKIEDICVTDSPTWMQSQLMMAGQRPVNGIVDVLNYVMLYLGQPMHAFDADAIDGTIDVRTAAAGEAFLALDGRKLFLAEGDLVVSDDSSVIALAGIMGSETSGVTKSTRNIVLESAFFRPASVSLTRRSHTMVSEASMRFERGVDPAMVEIAMQQTTKIITDLFGGTASEITVCGDTGQINAENFIQCDIKRIETRLGIVIPASADAVLIRMGFGIKHRGNILEVSVPAYRHDISIPEDISEEYARIIGFDAIPEVLPSLPTIRPVRRDTSIHDAVADGFVQVVNYAFISAGEQRLFVTDDGADIKLENPISDSMTIMRRSIWPCLLNTARHNLNRQQPGVALVEQGRIYVRTDTGHDENNVISWLMTGEVQKDEWHSISQQADFFDLKGAVESWLAARGLTGRFIADDSIQGIQAGQSAKILVGRIEIGRIGKVDSNIASGFDIDTPVFVAEIGLDVLPAGKKANFTAIPEFPCIERDLVFLFDRGTASDAILNAARSAAGKLLTGVRIFDLYEGKSIPDGKVSIGIRFTLQDASRTLTQEDSDKASSAIIEAMDRRFRASLRG